MEMFKLYKGDFKMRKSKKLLSALLALVMVLTAFPVMAFATSFQTRPADGTTEDQPFVTNQPSQYYRIPAVVTLSDGTLVAAADARWNTTGDGGGNDVIVTRSTNNGKTWSYSLLNYFGDNGNTHSGASTSFCDSEIATDGKNVYLLSTFFPAGRALNSANAQPTTEKAFDDQGRLLLKRSGESTYAYWLDTDTKDSNGRYVVRTISNNSIMSDATVDEEFYLYNASGSKTGSIFFSDGSYQTAKTTFLWFRSSNDGGVTWNAPKLLNVKNSGEMFLGVGPGRGLVTSKGDIVFATYTYGGSANSQRTYLVSSSDGGKTWNRTSGNATNDAWWSSEACPIELPNGKIRVFLRSEGKQMVYSDASRNSDGTYTWTGDYGIVKDQDGSSNIPIWSDCQQSALMYPYKIDGKNAILVSCPTNNSSSRKNGTIHLLLLDDNYNCVKRYTKAITAVDVDYQYSSMDVLNNGNIALLFESGNEIHYKEVNIHDIATGVTVDIPEVKNITLGIGETYSFVADTNSFGSYDKNVVQVSSSNVPSAKAQLGTDNSFSGEKISLSKACYHLSYSGSVYSAEATNGTNLYLDPIANGAGCPHQSTASTIRIETSRDAADTFYLSSNTKDTGGKYPYLMFWKGTSHDQTFDRWGVESGKTIADATTTDTNIINNMGGSLKKGAEMNLFRPVKVGETSSTEIPGYVKVPNLDAIETGNYLVAYKANNGSYYVAYASSNTSNKFTHVAKVLPNETETTNYSVTVTGLKDGVTSLKAGDTTYKFTVSSAVAVTGAVKYDPVIYTQGSDFKSFGTNISEGIRVAARKTNYQVAPGYEIDYIEVTEGVVASGTNIVPKNGILTGTVQLTAGNHSTSVYEKIKLKTFLKGPDGKTYTQENYLYVTTSPVPAHVVSVTNSYYQNWQGTQYITVAPMGLVAKGSTSSYNTTDYERSPSSTNQGNYANSIDLFNEDGMALSSFAAISNPKHDPKTAVTFTGDKLGGWYGYHSGSVSSDGKGQAVEGAFTGTTGHYYYDKSSSNNPGFKTSNGNTATIELVLNRPIISPANDWVHDDYGDTLDVNDFNVTIGGVTRTLSQQNSTPTVSGVSPAFKLFKYTAGNNGLQTFAVDVDTSSTGTINGNMYIKVSHARGEASWWALNYTTLPLQFHIADKSTVRTAYNKAITNNNASGWDVLVSSDYTPATWNEYQRQMLFAETYLNNYDYHQTQPTDLTIYGGNLEKAYNALQKIADFSELEKQLELKKDLYGIDLPFDESGHNLYTRDSWNTFQLNYTQGDDYANNKYASYETRVNTAGYNPTGKEGPHSTTLTDVQFNINTYAGNIKNYPIEIADPTAYEAARAIVATLDLDAYKDTVADKLTQTVTDGDADIYEVYQGKTLVRLPKTSQTYMDNTYTAVLVEKMNVANDTAAAADANKGKHTTVIFQVNGTQVFNQSYGYGVNLSFTVAPQWISEEQAKTATVKIVNDGTTQTEIPMPDNYKIKFTARANTTTVNIITADSPNVIVRDYFGTIIYSGTATEDQIAMDNDTATVTINGTAIHAKSSPALRFKSWQLTHEADGTICVIQKGVRIGDAHHFEATNGIVTRYNTTEPVTSFTGYGIPYTVTPNDGVTPIVWKMTVDGKEYLAAYESSFTRFAYNQDTVYTAITSEDELGALASAYGKPVSFGTGFISGDNSDKFTLACSYSAAPGTTVQEAGVLYSTNGDLTPATMTKGADGVSTKIQTRVSDFGTYTMTKTNAVTGTHLMRSYVSYTEVVEGKTVIRVTYGPVYQCVDGQISIVE